jgi:hypothetical protein
MDDPMSIRDDGGVEQNKAAAAAAEGTRSASDSRGVAAGLPHGAHGLVADSGATSLGAAVIVDGLTDGRLRRDLTVRSLLRSREVWS